VLDGLEPGTATIVVLMGLGSRAAVARALLDRGWPASTPAAVVRGASTESQSRWLGSLAELAATRADGDDAGSPGTVVIGGVVALAGRIRPSAEAAVAPPEAVTGGRADAL
jgi:siroheme synthase